MSALAVPVGSHAGDVDELKGKNVRLTQSGLLKNTVRSRITIFLILQQC